MFSIFNLHCDNRAENTHLPDMAYGSYYLPTVYIEINKCLKYDDVPDVAVNSLSVCSEPS